jgi:hypothetical protein
MNHSTTFSLMPSAMRTEPPHLRRAVLTAATACLAFAMPAQAQSATIGATLTTSVGPLARDLAGFQSFGQSFTAPNTLARLTSFSLSFTSAFNGGALRFDAYIYSFNTATQSVTGTSLWSELNVGGSGNEFAFDTRTFNTGGLLLNSGATYLFLITTSNQGASVPADAANLVGANDTNGYTGGSFWIARNGSNISALATTGAFTAVAGITDAAFTANVVVPEPTTVVLTAAGLFVLGAYRKRRAV